MRKNVKILICGLGSIGQRHYTNLVKLGYRDIIIYRTGKGANQDFVNAFIQKNQPVIFNDLAAALKAKPDIVFVTNPTSLHARTALAAARSGSHIFVEKPLADVLSGELAKLQKAVVGGKRKLFVAYHFRFHPLLKKVKKMLETGQIGTPLSVNVQMGERVSNWHPWEDYKKSYSSKKELGGGVVLTQSHDLDYLSWLLGPAKSVTAKGGTRGGLGINVEDSVDMLLSHASGVESLVHLDYVQSPGVRTLLIVGTRGRLFLNFNEGKLEVQKYDKKLPTVYQVPAKFDRNQMYVDEVEYFMSCIDNNKRPFNDLSEAIPFLKFLLAIKKQLTYGPKK
ncbi:MAG: Gfo/Idh/MocA family oxidoreductase [Patescibacteria group bacterium]